MKKIILCFFISILFRHISAQNFQFEDKWWMPNGPVNTVQTDTATNKVYIGGSFDMVGPRRPWSVHIRYKSGAVNANADVANDTVFTCISDGNGGWYLGGKFTKVGDSVRGGLAQVDSAGKVTAFMAGKSGVNGIVYSLALHNGKLYIGGKFTAVNGLSRKNLAAIWVLLSNVTPWIPKPDERVMTLAAKGNRIYAGGWFSMVDTANRFRIAAMDTGTGKIYNWNPGINGNVTAIALWDTFVFASGTFTAAAYNPASNFAMFSQNGNKLLTYIAPSNYGIKNIRIFGNTIYILGLFNSTSLGSYPNIEYYNYCITTFNLKNWTQQFFGFPATFSQKNDYFVQDIALVNGIYYMCGGFTKLLESGTNKTYYRSRFVAMDSATKTIVPMECNISDLVYQIVAGPSGLYACGEFISAGGVTRSNLARYDLNGYAPDNWTPRTNDVVYAIKVVKNKVFIGGKFNSINNTTRYGISCFDNNTNNVTKFNPSTDGTVYSLESSTNKLLVGGEFYSMGAVSRRNFAITDTALGYCFVNQLKTYISSIYQIKRRGNKIYYAGDFSDGTNARAVLRTDTGKFEIDSVSLTNISTRNGNCVYPSESKYFYGTNYSFESIPEFLYQGDSASNKRIAFNSKLNATVNDLVVYENTLIAAGEFTKSGTINRNRVAAFHLTPFELAKFNPSPDAAVKTLATAGKRLFMGGKFNKTSGTWQRGFAVYYSACAPKIKDTLNQKYCGDFYWNNIRYTKSGVYNFTAYNSQDCPVDSFMKLQINKPTYGKDTLTGCKEIWYKSVKYIYEGYTTDALTNSVGCDSVVTITLRIANINKTVLNVRDTLYSIYNGDSIKWLDCDNGNSIVPGANNRKFKPAKGGRYAAVMYKYGCVDTSACIDYHNLGMEAAGIGAVKIYPNPGIDRIQISAPENVRFSQLTVTHISGKTVLEIQNPQTHSIDISALSPGVYFLKIGAGEEQTLLRFQKI